MRKSSRSVEGLQFVFGELVAETAILRRMARNFFAAEGPGVLTAFERQLERIREGGTDRTEELTLGSLRTGLTRDYEAGTRSGRQAIYALIRGKWELRPIGQRGPKRKVAFVGKASAVIELWPADCVWVERSKQSERLAMWRIELGAMDAPGCYFHTQVLGDCDEPPFPKSVPIPRLPSPFVTPMAVVEFVLGELFQDRWQEEARRTRDNQRRWRSIQERRWSNLLEWQKDLITRRESSPWFDSYPSRQSSPWIDLKHAKPPKDLFLTNV